MQNLTRNKNITFRVTEQEYEMIMRQMKQAKNTSLRAYLLKQAIDGRVITVELTSVQECSRLLSNIANNINQLTKKVNSGENVYASQLSDIQQSLDKIFDQQNVINAKISKIIELS